MLFSTRPGTPLTMGSTRVVGESKTGGSPLVGLIIIGGAVILTNIIGGLGSAASGDEYSQLSTPDWAPPSWLFGPVWITLYVLTAVSGWLVWHRHGWNGARTALSLFFVQLALNAVWPVLFFAAGLRGVAFVEICLLVLVLGTVNALFWRLSRLAAILLLPYMAWTLFATVLNLSIWLLNT